MIDKIRQKRIVPVAAIDTLDNGLKLCETLMEGGLPVIEVTFRTAAAESIIKAAAKEFPEMLLGAGTILNTTDLQRAIDAGASFAVSPGTNPNVVSAALAQNFALCPGVCTPTDVETALELGCRALKFFPAEAAGGVKMLKSLIGPYGHLGISFCPTGGINSDNMLDYLALEQVFAVGGSWMVAKSLLGNWDKIRELTKNAVERASES